MGLKLSKALLATKDVVSTFLRCVASLIGRAVISERYLTGQLMQHVVGGLANLAQTEEVRMCWQPVFFHCHMPCCIE